MSSSTVQMGFVRGSSGLAGAGIELSSSDGVHSDDPFDHHFARASRNSGLRKPVLGSLPDDRVGLVLILCCKTRR